MGPPKRIKRLLPRRKLPNETGLIPKEIIALLMDPSNVKLVKVEATKKRQPHVKVNNDDHKYGEWKQREGSKYPDERAREITKALEKCYIQSPGPSCNMQRTPFSAESRIFDDVKEGIEAKGSVLRENYESNKFVRPSAPRARCPFNPLDLTPENDSWQNSLPNRSPSKPSNDPADPVKAEEPVQADDAKNPDDDEFFENLEYSEADFTRDVPAESFHPPSLASSDEIDPVSENED